MRWQRWELWKNLKYNYATSSNKKKKYLIRKSVQIGRGGKRGKTSGRGHKGQNARTGTSKRPEMRIL